MAELMKDPQELLEHLGRRAREGEIVEAAARAIAADQGLDLDNLAAHADPGDSQTDLALWRHNLDEAGRVAYEAIAPLIERRVREQVAQVIQARHDQLDETDVWENEGRGYLAEAVEIARGSVSTAKAVDHD